MERKITSNGEELSSVHATFLVFISTEHSFWLTTAPMNEVSNFSEIVSSEKSYQSNVILFR